MAYLRGQIVLMLIVGVVFTVAWTVIGIPGALVLGVIAGLLTLIPDVGPFLAAAMAVALVGIRMGLTGWFQGSVSERLAGVIAIVGGGMIVYFPLVWILGGTDREELKALLRRRRPYTDAG